MAITQNRTVSMVRWESLNPDILGQIFKKISPEADVIINTVSLVCKPWLEVVNGPYCWAEIGLLSWTQRVLPDWTWPVKFIVGSEKMLEMIDSVVQNLVHRSKCTVRAFSGGRIGGAGFATLANCGRFLTFLAIPASEVTDDMVEKLAGSLVNLEVLDITYCEKITAKGISYFGNSCHSLTILRRNLDCRTLRIKDNYDDEAYAIADTMQGLVHLELAYGSFYDQGLNKILTNCKSLTHLDIEGCENVKLGGDLKGRCEQLEVFKDHLSSRSIKSYCGGGYD